MTDHERLSGFLQDHGIQPSAQRVAIARFVLHTDRHPTADEVLAEVRRDFPMVSRATVYNTIRLFMEKGLLRIHQLEGGVAVCDANTARHHHFIDEDTGEIVDVPWDAVDVGRLDELAGLSVDSWMVVMRGRRRREPPSRD
ncbi:MAG: transcriptional repressor [bacterium]|nr:transcriptional repressor [bacterium]